MRKRRLTYPPHLRSWRTGETRYAQYLGWRKPTPPGAEEYFHDSHHHYYNRIVLLPKGSNMMHFHTATFYPDGTVRCRSTVKPHTIMLAAGQAHIESAGDLLGLSTQQLISLFNHLSDDERIKRVAPDTVERVWAMLSAPRHEASTYAPDAAAKAILANPQKAETDIAPAVSCDEVEPAGPSRARARRDGGASRPTAPSKGAKAKLIGDLLLRPEGCTSADVLAATGWPSVSMPAQAKACGLELRKEKIDGVTRYFGLSAK